MGAKLQEFTLKQFGTIGTLSDSTDSKKFSLATNCRGRPVGAISSGPLYASLCGIGNAAFVDATYFALTYTPFGSSPRPLVRASDKTIAIEIASQGAHFLLFYSLNTRKARGLFFMGNDGTFSGAPDFVAGSATMTVLAVGLDDNARWHGPAYYGALYLGNGVDADAVVQLARTTQAPGKWRTAASNQRPAAPVIRQIQTTATDNQQASWTIPGGARAQFFGNGYSFVEGSLVWGGGCHINAVSATGLMTKTVGDLNAPAATHGFLPGDQLVIGFDLGGGVDYYYVIASGLTPNAFKVSATLGGSAITGFGNQTNKPAICYSKLNAPGHTFTIGDVVNLSTTVLFPVGLTGGTVFASGTDYYVVAVSPDQVAISATLGGSPLVYGSNSLGICTMFLKSVSGTRMGGAALTFTADATNYRGTRGDNIYVSITYGTGLSGASMVASTMAGSGTVSDPYHYAIYTGAGFSSTQSIVDFVNNDTNAVGILSASASSVDAVEDTQSWAFHELTGGVDSTTINGVTSGFSDKTCAVYLRYWDPGVDFLGYEGISSDKSNVIVIDALSNFGIEVSLVPNPGVESGRFGFVRVYLQFNEDANAQWNLVGEVPNSVVSETVSTFALVACTASTSTNRFTKTAHGLANDTALRFNASGSLPGNINPAVTYYVINATANDFQVSATMGGAFVDLITTGGSGISYRLVQQLVAGAHPFVSGDTVRFTTTGTLPTGLSLATDYFVVNPSANAFGVALVTGGPAVNITTTGSGVHTATQTVRKLQLGASTPVGQVMYVDQNRPLPSTLAMFSGGNLWHGGVTEFPDRLYPSKESVFDELLPEGANAQAYEVMKFPASVSGQRVTALYSDDTNLHVHSPGAVVLFPPDNPDARFFPRVFAGAVTDSALCLWTQNRILYLGADLNLYQQTESLIQKLQGDFLALDAAAYMRSLVDLNQFATRPDRCFLFSDIAGQMLWMWLPGLDGSLTAFAYDHLQKGIVGPFSFPKMYAMVRMEVSRPEYIGCDEAGNLFVWDSSRQWDFDTILPTNSTPVVHTLGSGATTPSEAGFGQTAVPGGELWRSCVTSVETGYLDLGTPGQRKAFLALLISTVKNSRAVLSFTATDKSGRAVTVMYGDIYNKGIRNICKVLVNLADTAVKIRIDLISSEMKPFVVRDLTLQWTGQGKL